MDIQSVASQLISQLGSNPDLISQFAEHPYSTTAKVTGSNETISQKDMSRIITQVAAQASGQSLGTTDTKSLASALMGQSGGSVHQLASALFGASGTAGSSTTPSMAEIAAKSIAGGLAARGMASLITGVMSASKKNATEK